MFDQTLSGLLGQIGAVLNSVAAVFVILGLCIFFHELGHFVVAKLSRMKVEEFAFGLGPVAAGFRRGETLYAIRWIPFGGLVRITGMEPGERQAERGFFSRPRPLGAATIIAGVTMNIVLALLLFFVVNLWQGMPVPGSRAVFIGDTFKDMPARGAGLQAGDKVLAVNDERHSLLVSRVVPGSPAAKAGIKPGYSLYQINKNPVNTPTDLVAALAQHTRQSVTLAAFDTSSTSTLGAAVVRQLHPPAALAVEHGKLTPDAALRIAQKQLGLTFDTIDTSTFSGYIAARPSVPVRLRLERYGKPLQITVTPRKVFDRVVRIDSRGRLMTPVAAVGRIGITLKPEMQPMGVLLALRMAGLESVGAVRVVVESLVGMLTHKIAASPSGPVGIIAETARQASIGWSNVLQWGGLISANLAVINLIPIPPFDGFWLLLLLFEGVTRRSANERVEIIIRFVGLMLIAALFVGLVAKDLWNLAIYRVP